MSSCLDKINLYESWETWAENIFFLEGFNFASVSRPGVLSISRHSEFFLLDSETWELCKFKPILVEFSEHTFSSPSKAKTNTNYCPCRVSLLEADFFFFPEPVYYWSWGALRVLILMWGNSVLMLYFSQGQGLLSWPPGGSTSLF